MIKNINESFPSEKVCSHVLRRLHLDFLVKNEIENSTLPIRQVMSNTSERKIICPRCRCHNLYTLRSGKYLFKCTGCEKKIDARTHTIFQGGQLSIRQYFIAIFLYYANKTATSKKTDTGSNLAKILNVSEKTAYELLRQLRFLDQVNSNTDDETRMAGCKRFNLPFDSKEKFVYNKALLGTINDFLEKDENLSSIKTVLKEDDVSLCRM